MSDFYKIADIYKNSPCLSALYKFLIYEYNAQTIYIWWKIDNLWLLDEYVINREVIKDGNYFDEPIELQESLSNLIDYDLEFTRIKIDLVFTKEQMFMLETFLFKIYHLLTIRREKKVQDIFIQRLTNNISNPMKQILNNVPLEYKNHIIELANGIFDNLDLMKLENGSLQLKKSLVNLQKLIEEIIGVTNISKIPINYYIEKSVPIFVYVDPTRLKQVLLILLQNSLKYTKEGEIRLYISAELINLFREDAISGGPECHIYNTSHQYNLTFLVEDSGVGISKEVQKSLFRPPDITSSGSLRIAYLLAKKMDGGLNLMFSSDKGSCFRFEIVTIDEEPQDFDRYTLKILSGKKILVIYDNDQYQDICELLDKYKCVYALACSIRELEILHSNEKYNLVILLNSDQTVKKYAYDRWKVIDIDTNNLSVFKTAIIRELITE